jgi:hypothetical protein
MNNLNIFKEFVSSLRRDNNDAVINAIIEGIDVLTESVTRDIGYLYQYLKADPVSILPYDYPFMLSDWLDDYDIELPSEITDWDDSEKVEWLQTNNPKAFKQFGNYLLNSRTVADDGHTKISFDTRPKLMRNAWFIHFTDDASSIWREGFTHGTQDMSYLGLTTQRSMKSKSSYPKWAFAYDVNDFARYYRSGRYDGPKYGSEAVVFQASGVKADHYGDEEPQVIFDIDTAKNIIAIEKWDNEKYGDVWAVMNKDSKTPIFQAQGDEWKEFERCVKWIISNYGQYKNAVDIHKNTKRN